MTRLEHGVRLNRVAESGTADPSTSRTTPEPDLSRPDSILVNWTLMRPDEVARPFAGAVARRTVFRKGNPDFWSPQANWADLVQKYNVFVVFRVNTGYVAHDESLNSPR